MKRFICIGFLCVFFFSGIAISAPLQWSSVAGGNDHWYEAVSSTSDWNATRILAENATYNGLQGHLASISSQQENDWIWQNLGLITGYFLGGTDQISEGNWEWITGETWGYTNWNNGEPNNVDWLLSSGEDGLIISTEGRWNDVPISNYYERGYIIEYEPASVPEPATLLLFGTGLIGFAGFRKRSERN
jgi:hypothetical protein